MTPKRAPRHSADVALTVRKALASREVKRLSLTQWEWDTAGNCQHPVPVDLYGRGHKSAATGRTYAPIGIIIHAPCRRCETCLRRRAAFWSAQAINEFKSSARTWFGTLTLAPENHARFQMRAYQRDQSISDDRLFSVLASEESKEVTKYFKRLRKEGLIFRYMLVAESHKSGLPHFHLLLHELLEGQITKRALQEQWRLGFSNWRLARDQSAAFYCSKYLAKNALSRVRASLGYGRSV